MKLPRRRTIAFVFAGFLAIFLLSVWLGIRTVTARFFTEHANRLAIEGELHAIPFEWIANRYEGYTEEHGAILLPVTVPGIDKQLYMQFDTGSPSTFLRSGCLESLVERGVNFEFFDDNGTTRVRKFEILVGENHVVLNGGWVMRRNISIKWDKPINIIGSIGADLIDGRMCAFDFPAQKIRMYRERTAELNSLGNFQAFRFPGRRIMLPAKIGGIEMELLYDSGCSPFGLLTSKHHCDRYRDPKAKAISIDANRFGSKVPVHHFACPLGVKFGEISVPIRRVSYVDHYSTMQSLFGGLVDGGFMGNKFLLDSTLLIDAREKEFLVVPKSLEQEFAAD